MTILYFVTTPIGNLEYLSPCALRILGEARPSAACSALTGCTLPAAATRNGPP